MPLSIHVGINVDGAVQINLNKAIAAIALDSKTAVEIGVMLIQHAAIVDNAAMDMVAAGRRVDRANERVR